MSSRLGIDEATLAQFCRRRRIRRIALFGSTLRQTAGPNSDVDLLVEFEADATPSLLDLADIEQELSTMLGRRADVRTEADLSRYFRDTVLREAEVQYEST